MKWIGNRTVRRPGLWVGAFFLVAAVFVLAAFAGEDECMLTIEPRPKGAGKTNVWGVNEAIKYQAVCTSCGANHDVHFAQSPAHWTGGQGQGTNESVVLEGSENAPCSSIVLKANCGLGGQDKQQNVSVVSVTGLTVNGDVFFDTNTERYYCTKDNEGSVTVTVNLSEYNDWPLPKNFIHWSKHEGSLDFAVEHGTPRLNATVSRATPGMIKLRAKAGTGPSAPYKEVTIVVLATGWVEFDCTMEAVSASLVVTATGSEPIFNQQWHAESPKTKVYFDYNPDIATDIRVSAAQATSANNGVQLDGNGVRPNGDDFQFSINPTQ